MSVDSSTKSPADASSASLTESASKSNKRSRLLKLLGRKLNGEKKEKAPTVPFFQLFRFSSASDKLLMIIGTVAACASGSAEPLLNVFFADIIGSFLKFTYNPNSLHNPQHRNELDHTTRKYCWYFFALGLGMWVVSTIQKLCWNIASERIGKRVRETFYTSILRQDISWFDEVTTGELTSRISGDVNLLQDGVGEKFSYLIQYTCTFIVGIIIAFARGWKLTLVVLAVLPVVVGSGSIMGKFIAARASGGQDAYAEAGGVADEVLSSIKTVMAFGGEERELKRYDEKLKKARAAGLRKAVVVGTSVGFIMFTIYSAYALGFWYGGKLIRQDEVSPATVIAVFLCLLNGGFSLGNAAPNLNSIASARGAAGKVYMVIDRKSPIDPVDTENGLSAENIAGEIELSSVNFRYPTRKDVQVLHDFSIHVKPGQKIALVGESGCGKSTMISLVERFYDPESGAVKIDGVDIKEYNVRSLRQQI
ncbi:hypothetical protein GGI12_005790, partial [Dipsacomyces acuminosporus]